MTSSDSPCLGWVCRNLLSRLLRSSWVETGSSADSLQVQKAGSSAGSSHRPQVQKAEASGCSSLLQSEAGSSPLVQKAEASGYRVITPGPKGGGIRLPRTSSVRGRVIRRLRPIHHPRSKRRRHQATESSPQIQKAEASGYPSLLQSEAESSGDSSLLQSLQVQKPQCCASQRTLELVLGVVVSRCSLPTKRCRFLTPL